VLSTLGVYLTKSAHEKSLQFKNFSCNLKGPLQANTSGMTTTMASIH